MLKVVLKFVFGIIEYSTGQEHFGYFKDSGVLPDLLKGHISLIGMQILYSIPIFESMIAYKCQLYSTLLVNYKCILL